MCKKVGFNMNLTEFAKEVHENAVNHGWWEQSEYSETFCAVDDTVTHWMPMPEPPKGE